MLDGRSKPRITTGDDDGIAVALGGKTLQMTWLALFYIAICLLVLRSPIMVGWTLAIDETINQASCLPLVPTLTLLWLSR